MSSSTNLYNGLGPSHGYIVANSSESLYLTTGDDTTLPETIAAGQVIEVGQVLARSSADGKVYIIDAAAGDDLELPVGIALYPIDTSATGSNADDENAILIRTTRLLNANAIKLDAAGTLTLDGIKDELNKRGLPIRSPGYSG